MNEEIKKIIEKLDERLNLHNIIKEPISSDLDKAIKLSVAYEDLLEENKKLKEQLERSEKARKKLEDKINKTNVYINSNPLVCVGDYEYFVNDILQMESFSNKMSFIRTLKEFLDIDKGELMLL